MSKTPTASVAVPTRDRPEYLQVALASIAPQASRLGAEVIVVSDGPDPRTEQVALRHGAKAHALRGPSGLNAARNEAVRAAAGPLIVFVDDDVSAPPGWLDVYLQGAARWPDREVFGGPIEARLEGGGPRACGHEGAPITTLDLGDEDRDVPLVWGANMAIRASAFDRLGSFDEAIFGTGDEEEWLARYRATGGRVRYLAAARLEHRRTPADSRLDRLAAAAYVRGQAARRYDTRRGAAPPIASELKVLAGCTGHTMRRRCSLGIVFAAHSAGRIRQALTDYRRSS